MRSGMSISTVSQIRPTVPQEHPSAGELGCRILTVFSGFLQHFTSVPHEFDDPAVRDAFIATEQVAERFLMTNASGEFRYAVGGFYRILLDQSAALAQEAVVAQTAADRRTEIGASAAAVLTAAAACDTFVSEYLERSEMFRLFDAATLEGLRREQDATEQWKALIRARAKDWKAAAAFDPSASPEYAELRCLIRLRNHVAHRHSRLTPLDTWPTGLAACVARGTIPVEDEPFFDWATVAYRQRVAAWASATAAKWIDLMERTLGFPC